MSRSTFFLIGIATTLGAAASACSANGGNTEFGAGGAGGAGSATSSKSSATTGVGVGSVTTGAAVGSVGSGPSSCDTKPDEDSDGDGFSVKQGDCNDCDPNINPAAVDTPAIPDSNGGTRPASNNDCSPTLDLDVSCDNNIAFDDTSAEHGANAIDICQKVDLAQKKYWGLVDAKYVSANGSTPRVAGLQTGVLTAFGSHVLPRLGKAMLGLSSGHMRVPGQPGFCMNPSTKLPEQSCDNGTEGTPPTGFPQKVAGCALDPTIHDDIALEVKLTAPSNATGYKFNFKFYSFEFPEWVCSHYNDQFIALASPPPKGAINGNISFDSANNPVGVAIAFFDVCDAATKDEYSKQGCNNCKVPPNPYCPNGTDELLGTGMLGSGFDVKGRALDAGGTRWLETTAPIKGGDTFTLRFAIWDTGDHNIDSHVIIDSFQWIATPGVTVGTKPPA
jgi:hypothetical protein